MVPSVLLSKLVASLLLPPLCLVLLLLFGMALRRRWPRLGIALMLTSGALLFLLSTDAGTRILVAPLEQKAPPATAADIATAQAIVILGAGRQSNAPEFGHADQPSLIGLKRLAYGVALHKQSGLPILVTAGSPDGAPESEAAIMARALKDLFSTETRWIEGASNNTAENAQFSASMLNRDGIHTILLVTDALHMARSQWVFAATGLKVIPAPTMFPGAERVSATDFIPSASALSMSSYALHEWIGMLWYDLRYPKTTSSPIPKK